MLEPVGLSLLYPGVPIACFFSMLALLLLVPGFWKTRVWALLAIVGWIFLGNLLRVIGMLCWRGSIHDAPIFADLLTGLLYIQPFGLCASMTCFARFVWQRSRHLSELQILDNRRRNNIIDGFVSLGLPLLWLPTFLFSCSARYYILEDYGPTGSMWADWTGFLISTLPSCLSALAQGTFYALALLNYWRLKGETNPHEKKNDLRNRKLLYFCLASLLLSGFMIGWTVECFLQYFPVSSWGDPNAVNTPTQNIPYLKIVRYVDRVFADSDAGAALRRNCISISICTPILGFYMFAWFGLGEEARKSYREALSYLVRLFGVRSDSGDTHVIEGPASLWKRALRPFKFTRRSNDLLPTAGAITPFRLPSNQNARRRSRSSVSVLDIGYTEKAIPSSVTTAASLSASLESSTVDPNQFGRLPSPRRSCHKPRIPLNSMNNPTQQPSVSDSVSSEVPVPPSIPAPTPPAPAYMP